MKRTTSKALLVLGWLLMAPPVDTDPDTVPIARGKQISAFDTARECEEAVGRQLEFADEGGDEKRAERVLGSRCVPAEHVYPPKPASTN